jgi:Flp pilus assembly pilin Flp
MEKHRRSRNLGALKSRRVSELLADTRGLTTVEYVIVLCLIAVVCFAVWQQFGGMVKDRVNSANDVLSAMPTE